MCVSVHVDVGMSCVCCECVYVCARTCVRGCRCELCVLLCKQHTSIPI